MTTNGKNQESTGVKFNPAAAIEAHANAERFVRHSQEINETLTRRAGTELVKKTVAVPGPEGSRSLSMPEYVEWLGEQATTQWGTFEQAGGEKALRAAQGISYAGEIPDKVNPTSAEFSGFPTLP